MSEAVKPIPEGYHSVTPHLVCREALKALDFYKNALGAEIRNVSKDDRGNVMHAELKIGDSIVMLSDEFPHSTVSRRSRLAAQPCCCTSTPKMPTRFFQTQSRPAQKLPCRSWTPFGVIDTAR